MIKDNFDSFLRGKRKFSSSFPDCQFSIHGYSVIRKTLNENWGSIFFHINKDIAFKVIETNKLQENSEILLLELFSENLNSFEMEL